MHHILIPIQWLTLLGNEALAKELNLKGKLHNIHTKAAHGKAQEAIYCQRNPVSQELQRNAQGEMTIYLHGLHVNEAIHVLKHELNVLRSCLQEVLKVAVVQMKVPVAMANNQSVPFDRKLSRWQSAMLPKYLQVILS